MGLRWKYVMNQDPKSNKERKKMFVVNFAKKQQNWLTGFAPKLNMLISFEMSCLELGSFAQVSPWIFTFAHI